MSTQPEREKILARVQEALRLPSPVHGNGHPGASSNGRTPVGTARQWLPQVPPDEPGRLEVFRRTATDLKAAFRLVRTREELAQGLQEIARSESWTKIATHAGELTDFASAALGLPVCRTESGYDVKDLESCSAGITQCDALIAQTGSVLVTSRSAGGRALSVLPPHHVVLARRSQLLPDLTEAFAVLREKYGGNYPSFISFITGPSRTGDIERILVLGAHGPKKLTIFCLE